MQFLVIFRTRTITDTTFRRAQKGLLLTAQKLLEYREQGKIVSSSLMNHRTPLYTYALPDVDSADELHDLIWALPAFRSCTQRST